MVTIMLWIIAVLSVFLVAVWVYIIILTIKIKRLEKRHEQHSHETFYA